MSKTLKELSDELKAYLIEIQSDAHNKGNFRPERYNNLKLSMNIASNRSPHVIVTLAMSSAEYDLKTGEKTNGGLGPDERLVLRWLGKQNSLPNLMECWKNVEKNRGRIDDKFKV